jgi:membrane-bound ClpP family serine protease
MSTDLTWPIVCIAVALVLMIVEVFIPSGGLIGLLAIGLLIVGVWKAFLISPATGMKTLLALLVLVPATVALAFHLWPRTPLGRQALLKAPAPEEIQPDWDQRLDLLVGQFGRAVTPLRPSGLVDFDGRHLDGLSEQGLIPAGSLVRAVRARGGQLIVRTATDPSLDDLVERADNTRNS